MPKNAFLPDGHVNDVMIALLSDSLMQQSDVTPDVPHDVLDHVDQCIECKDKIMDVVLFLQDPNVGSTEESSVTRPIHRTGETIPLTIPRKNRHFFQSKIAAVFVAMAVTIAAFYLVYQTPLTNNPDSDNPIDGKNNTPITQTRKTTPPSSRIQPKATKPTPTVRNTKPEDPRYSVNPNLENMVDSRMRGVLPEALTPQNNSVQKGPIRFSWVNAFSNSHTLKIVNNRNNVVYSFPVSGDYLEIDAKLENGLYYWKLESENELLHVGKFFVGKALDKDNP